MYRDAVKCILCGVLTKGGWLGRVYSTASLRVGLFFISVDVSLQLLRYYTILLDIYAFTENLKLQNLLWQDHTDMLLSTKSQKYWEHWTSKIPSRFLNDIAATIPSFVFISLHK